jgi:hypothetical protein
MCGKAFLAKGDAGRWVAKPLDIRQPQKPSKWKNQAKGGEK